MELSRNRDVFASATLGGFAGFKIGNTWWGQSCVSSDASSRIFCGLGEITIFGFAGLTQNLSGAAPSSSSSSGGSSNSLTGVSYGGGIMFPVGDLTRTPTQSNKLHVGALVGFDHANNNSHFQYNDKSWVSLVLGVSF